MVSRKVVVREFETKKEVETFEVGIDGVEFIKFARGNLVVRGKIEYEGEMMSISRTIPLKDYEVVTISDGAGVPEEYKAKGRARPAMSY